MEHLLPKKLLRIEDLTFVLPDFFEGELPDALRLLANYLDIEFTYDENVLKSNEEDNTDNKILLFENSNNKPKASLRYGIFELDENGNYQLK